MLNTGSRLFAHLCTEEYIDNEPAPKRALRCMLMEEHLLIARHVGFASLSDGIVTLAVLSTLGASLCVIVSLSLSLSLSLTDNVVKLAVLSIEVTYGVS